MSWSMSFEATGDQAREFAGMEYSRCVTAGVIPAEQFKRGDDTIQKAINVMADMVESGVVGPMDKLYRFSLSGHANINHEPEAGWANDFVSIVITQLSSSGTEGGGSIP